MYTNDRVTPHLHIIFARRGKFADVFGHSMEHILYIKYLPSTFGGRSSLTHYIFLWFLRPRAINRRLPL